MQSIIYRYTDISLQSNLMKTFIGEMGIKSFENDTFQDYSLESISHQYLLSCRKLASEEEGFRPSYLACVSFSFVGKLVLFSCCSSIACVSLVPYNTYWKQHLEMVQLWHDDVIAHIYQIASRAAICSCSGRSIHQQTQHRPYSVGARVAQNMSHRVVQLMCPACYAIAASCMSIIEEHSMCQNVWVTSDLPLGGTPSDEIQRN